jgi:hypothetical protein
MSFNSPRACCVLIQSVLEVLSHGEALLELLDDAVYTRKVPVGFNSSIGGHYRHCLDHFQGLLDCLQTGDLDYDRRERGTLVENDRFAALNATRGLREAYERVPVDCLDRALEVTCKTSYAECGSQSAPSTVGREVMYVVAHAVHHFALIGIMGRLMGLEMPAGFGVAPSTLKHQTDSAAADVRRL